MRLAIDYQIFSLQRYGGISRYFVELAKQLIALHVEVQIIAPSYCNHYLTTLPTAQVVGKKISVLPTNLMRVFYPYNQLKMQHYLRSFKPQLLHESYYSPFKKRVKKYPTVITIHDMVHELYPQYFYRAHSLSNYKRLAVNNADHVICVSTNTRNDLITLFSVAAEKISVVPLGFSIVPHLSTNLKGANLNHGRPFILYVGHRGGYKNFSTLLYALASSYLKADFDLIAFGGGKFSRQEKSLQLKLGFHPQQVKQCGGSDFFLAQLYQQANAFVYPSFYEGFGLPPLEAMAYGCPVIVSNTSSLPEVVGHAGEYFQPNSVTDLRRALETVLCSTDYNKLLIKRGFERLTQFSWKKCAQQTYSIYQNLLN